MFRFQVLKRVFRQLTQSNVWTAFETCAGKDGITREQAREGLNMLAQELQKNPNAANLLGDMKNMIGKVVIEINDILQGKAVNAHFNPDYKIKALCMVLDYCKNYAPDRDSFAASLDRTLGQYISEEVASRGHNISNAPEVIKVTTDLVKNAEFRLINGDLKLALKVPGYNISPEFKLVKAGDSDVASFRICDDHGANPSAAIELPEFFHNPVEIVGEAALDQVALSGQPTKAEGEE